MCHEALELVDFMYVFCGILHIALIHDPMCIRKGEGGLSGVGQASSEHMKTATPNPPMQSVSLVFQPLTVILSHLPFTPILSLATCSMASNSHSSPFNPLPAQQENGQSEPTGAIALSSAYAAPMNSLTQEPNSQYLPLEPAQTGSMQERYFFSA